MNVDSQLELIVCSQTSPHLKKKNTKFELTAEYLITPTQGPSAQRSKGKGEKLVTSHNQCSLEESFNSPSIMGTRLRDGKISILQMRE